MCLNVLSTARIQIVLVLFCIFTLCSNIEKKNANTAIQDDSNLDQSTHTVNTGCFDSSKCTDVSGISNGLQFSGKFIKDSILYLNMTFKNVSNKTIVFFPPYYYGNQGIKTLGFVKLLVSEESRKRIIKSSLFVTAFRWFYFDRLVPNDSVSYKQKVGVCSCNEAKFIKYKLRYKFLKSWYEEDKEKLQDRATPDDIRRFWFGEIETDSGFICCDSVDLTDQIFFDRYENN